MPGCLLSCCSKYHIVYFRGINTGSSNGMLHRMATHDRCFGIVECAAKSFTNGCAGGTDYNCISHVSFLFN